MQAARTPAAKLARARASLQALLDAAKTPVDQRTVGFLIEAMRKGADAAGAEGAEMARVLASLASPGDARSSTAATHAWNTWRDPAPPASSSTAGGSRVLVLRRALRARRALAASPTPQTRSLTP
jgi:hypothetical protein